MESAPFRRQQPKSDAGRITVESRHTTIIDQSIATQPDACADDRCRLQREYDEQSIARA